MQLLPVSLCRPSYFHLLSSLFILLCPPNQSSRDNGCSISSQFRRFIYILLCLYWQALSKTVINTDATDN